MVTNTPLFADGAAVIPRTHGSQAASAKKVCHRREWIAFQTIEPAVRSPLHPASTDDNNSPGPALKQPHAF
jgi:hypothetical protein